MMSDIRSFFGGGPPKPKAEVKPVDDGEPMLVDSDDEDGKAKAKVAEAKPKKRLKVKSAKAVESTTKTENAPSQPSAAAAKMGRSSSEAIYVDGAESSTKKQKVVSPNKEEKVASPTKASPKKVKSPKVDKGQALLPTMPVLGAAVKKEEKRQTLNGGAAGFFGDAPVPESPPTKVARPSYPSVGTMQQKAAAKEEVVMEVEETAQTGGQGGQDQGCSHQGRHQDLAKPAMVRPNSSPCPPRSTARTAGLVLSQQH